MLGLDLYSGLLLLGSGVELLKIYKKLLKIERGLNRMKIWIPKNREDLRKHLSDPLFKNAYFLMLSSITSAGLGFFFWIIAARFYSAERCWFSFSYHFSDGSYWSTLFTGF